MPVRMCKKLFGHELLQNAEYGIWYSFAAFQLQFNMTFTSVAGNNNLEFLRESESWFLGIWIWSKSREIALDILLTKRLGRSPSWNFPEDQKRKKKKENCSYSGPTSISYVHHTYAGQLWQFYLVNIPIGKWHCGCDTKPAPCLDIHLMIIRWLRGQCTS